MHRGHQALHQARMVDRGQVGLEGHLRPLKLHHLEARHHPPRLLRDQGEVVARYLRGQSKETTDLLPNSSTYPHPEARHPHLAVVLA